MSVTATFAFVLILLAVGRLLRARGIAPEGAAETLNAIALYVCMPAAVLLNVPQLVLDRSLLGLVAVPWMALGASATASLLLARIFGWDRAVKACLLLQAPLGNTAFIGYALVPALAGAGALRYAVVYDQFGTFMILGTVGLLVIAAQSGAARPKPLAVALRVATFPPFVALVAGVTIVPAHLPVDVARPLEMLSGALLPIVGLAVGMQLRLKLPRRHVGPLVFAIVAKLGLVPLLALVVCGALGLRGEVRAAAVLESAMPTMMTTGALLATAGLAPDLAAAIIGYTTVASMLTLPLWQHALTAW